VNTYSDSAVETKVMNGVAVKGLHGNISAPTITAIERRCAPKHMLDLTALRPFRDVEAVSIATSNVISQPFVTYGCAPLAIGHTRSQDESFSYSLNDCAHLTCALLPALTWEAVTGFIKDTGVLCHFVRSTQNAFEDGIREQSNEVHSRISSCHHGIISSISS